MTTFWWLRRLVAFLVWSQTVFADTKAFPAKYKLPSNAIPSNYKLELNLDQNTFDPNNAWTGNTFETTAYTGKVTITVDVQIDNLTEMKLHAKGLQIHDSDQIIILSTVLENNASTSTPKEVTPIDRETDIFSVIFDPALKKGQHVITIPFDGELETQEMDGFYKSTYKNKGQDEFLATTQFEPTSARRAFPCFDEPALKATFDLTITYPKGYKAMSNTLVKGTPTIANDSETVTFLTTPKMSTYHLAFIISKFECNKEIVANSVDVVCARPGEIAKNTTKLASEVPAKILDVIKDFTGFDYLNSNIGKLTHVAIPDFAAGGMENWGLITYREVDLLWDPNESSDSYQSKIVSTISHELAQEWFSALVTAEWWSNIFLNEGFAAYFEYHAPIWVPDYQSYDLEQRFVIEKVQNALADDVDEDHLALHHDGYTQDEISDRFDSISYDKGGSVLRKLQHIVGLENFKKGLTKYIDDNKFGNTEPRDLWRAFNSLNITSLPKNESIASIMLRWTNQNGYPLVKAELKDKTVTLSQTHFHIGAKSNRTFLNWSIPISYITSSDLRIKTEPKVWILGDSTPSITLPEDDFWVILNVQQTGYFRVAYGQELWKPITNFLKTDKIKSVPELNRAQIVDDLFNLAKAGVRSYSDTLNLLAFLKNDDSYYTWYSALNGFDYLVQRVTVEDKQVTEALTKYITDAMSPILPILKANTSAYLIDNTLKNGNFIDVQKLNLALTWSCRLNNEACVNYAIQKFKNFVRDPSANKPHRNIRSVVYCNAIRYSENLDDDWSFLLIQLQKTSLSTEQVTILKALGCAKDHDIIKMYLRLAINNNLGLIRNQDAIHAFTSSYQSNPQNVDVVLNFIVDCSNKMFKHFNSNKDLVAVIQGIADRLFTVGQIRELEYLGSIYGNNMAPEVSKAIFNAVEKANKNMVVASRLYNDLVKYFDIKRHYPSTADINVVNFVALIPTIVLLISIYYR